LQYSWIGRSKKLSMCHDRLKYLCNKPNTRHTPSSSFKSCNLCSSLLSVASRCLTCWPTPQHNYEVVRLKLDK
jgi:hypothetical protein